MPSKLLQAGIIAGALCSFMTGCSGEPSRPPAMTGCSIDVLHKIASRYDISMPSSATISFCRDGDNEEPDAGYISFSAPPDIVQEFLKLNGIQASSRNIGLQRNVAKNQGWPIADLPYFTADTEGAQGSLQRGASGFQLAIDERNPESFTLYLYLHRE